MTVFPVSYAQRSLWLLHQFSPEGGSYNVNIPLRIRSSYNESHLHRCLERLFQRHEMLRARYVFNKGQLGYEIAPSVPWSIHHINISPEASDAEVEALVSQHSHKTFELDKYPVFRVILFTRREDDHIFLFSTHHINGDLFSIVQLMEELFTLYASPDPEKEPLPPIQATFAEHVTEQQQFLKSPEGERQESYWSSHLTGPLPKLALPLDFPRPPIQNYLGAMMIQRLPPEIFPGFRSLAKSEKITFFTLLLAVFYATLHACTQQQDLIVGTPVPGRRGESRYERVMGTFVNVLALRAQCAPQMTFREFAQSLSLVVQQGRENQDFPFAYLVERLRLPRDTSRTPIFQTYFTLQRLGHRPEWLAFYLPTSTPLHLKIGDMEVNTFPLPQQEGQMELAVHIYDIAGDLYAEYKYNKDMLKPATVERFADCYTRTAVHILEHMGDLLSQFPAFLTDTIESECPPQNHSTFMLSKAWRDLDFLLLCRLGRIPVRSEEEHNAGDQSNTTNTKSQGGKVCTIASTFGFVLSAFAWAFSVSTPKILCFIPISPCAQTKVATNPNSDNPQSTEGISNPF